jgi:hypothetical protein
MTNIIRVTKTTIIKRNLWLITFKNEMGKIKSNHLGNEKIESSGIGAE